MTRENKKNFMIDLLFFIVVAALIYIVFRFLLIYLFPFVIGLAISALVQRPAAFLSSKIRLSRGKCALILVVLSYAALFAVLGFGAYKLVGYISGFAANAPALVASLSNSLDRLKEILQGFAERFPDGLNTSLSDMPGNLLGTVVSQLTAWISSLAASAAKQAPGLFVSIVVTLVASCYIAKDYDTVKAYALSLLKQKHREMLSDTKKILKENIFKIIKGYIILMFITFAELSVGLLLLRVQNAVAIAAGIAVLDVLPVLGTGTILIPWALLSLINGSFTMAIGLIILYIITIVVRNMTEPKIIGGQVGLHPLITLLAIFIGLKLFGFIGMISVPLAIIIIYNFYKAGKFDFLSFKQ